MELTSGLTGHFAHIGEEDSLNESCALDGCHAETRSHPLSHGRLIRYNAALRQRGSLSVWFDPDTVWHAGKPGDRGRPETFSDAAVRVCLTLLALFDLPLRQTVGLVESLVRMAGLDWPVPDYSTQCRRQARIRVQAPYRRSGKPLNLLVDNEPWERHWSE